MSSTRTFVRTLVVLMALLFAGTPQLVAEAKSRTVVFNGPVCQTSKGLFLGERPTLAMTVEQPDVLLDACQFKTLPVRGLKREQLVDSGLRTRFGTTSSSVMLRGQITTGYFVVTSIDIDYNHLVGTLETLQCADPQPIPRSTTQTKRMSSTGEWVFCGETPTPGTGCTTVMRDEALRILSHRLTLSTKQRLPQARAVCTDNGILLFDGLLTSQTQVDEILLRYPGIELLVRTQMRKP